MGEEERREQADRERKQRERGERERLARAAAARRAREEMRPGKEFRDCSECPEMVVLPAGSFMMGSPVDEANRAGDEGPRHQVRIGEGIGVGKYEVTRREFGMFVGETGHDMRGGCRNPNYTKAKWELDNARSWRSPGLIQGEKDPVVCVSWEDAKGYVEWLTGKTGKGYRLLCESEWEYAVRAGTRTGYSWGGEIGVNRANCVGCGSRWDDKSTARVGSFAANGYGLHDMHGNVSEWVEDCWHGDYEGAPGDGRAWATGGDCSRRLLRGGSWLNYPGYLRSAYRLRLTAGSRYNDLGFRVARTLTP